MGARSCRVASQTSTNVQANGASSLPALSVDGRWLAFWSGSNNLVAGDTNNIDDIFVRDNWTKSVARVSIASNGTQASGPPIAFGAPAISDDGRVVAFVSRPSLAANDTNIYADVYWHDRDTDQDEIYDEPGAIATVLASAVPTVARRTT